MKIKNRVWLYRFTVIMLLILSLSCNKEKDVIIIMNPWIEYGSMTDRDGNIYKTIRIGTQTWMVQNLKTTKFNDGTSIPVVTDAILWSNLSIPACCWQNNDPPRKVTYGVLYNWYTVNSGKLCPSGWHVPGDEEWTKLTDYLGGENVAGGKLKETGFKHWYSPNTGATDETHFSAFPGGERQNGPDALFINLRATGCWWTTAFNEDLAVNRILSDNSNKIRKSFYSKKCGLSVRCVWDY